MKTNFFKLLSITFTIAIFSLALPSCDKKEEDNSSEVKQELTDLKKEVKDVGNSIGDLFNKEQDNFSDAANEVLGDLDRKIDKIKLEIKNGNDDPNLAEQLNKLEAKADNLEKEISKLDEKTEEELIQAKENLKKGFNELKNDIEAMM